MQARLSDQDPFERPPGWDVRAQFRLPNEAATADFAAGVAKLLAPGDTLLLQGEIGAGKSFFARALIRAWLDDPMAEVPSPTFTLVQSYLRADVEIWHADLYRLADPQEVWELGLDAAIEDAICLLEWPERIAPDWPDAALCMGFATPLDDPDAREVTLASMTEHALLGRVKAALP